MNDHCCSSHAYPPGGTMYVFEGDNLVATIRKEAGVLPTHLLSRSRLSEGRYTIVCVADDGSVFKRDYECEVVSPPLRVRPVVR